ncbi:MAG: D-alanyl-D-alanine carboxypeptidase family protein [Actinobacteria bacterium]|nr:D-alanyl-D-alanine carboxypeptidase family protein [Actinomycetota bacterium]
MAMTSPRSASPQRLQQRSWRWTAFAALALAGTFGMAIGSSLDVGAVATDTRTQRSNVRSEQAKVAAKVNALESSQEQVMAALQAMEENVRGQQAVLSEARRQAEVSAAEAAQAERDAAQTTRDLDALRARVARYAVKAYVEPPGEELMRRFEAASAQEDATRNAFLNMQSRSDSDVIDQLRSTKARLEEELARAQAAKSAAETHAAEAEGALQSLSVAQSQQQAYASQVRQRLDETLSDAAFLSRMDAELGRQIAAEAAALAKAVGGVPSSGSGSGSGSGSSNTTTPPSSGSGTTTTTPPSGNNPYPTPSLTTVNGITVASSVAERVRGLMNAAAADGINLSGYGYRDFNAQIALRRQNCGTTQYAIWEMPPDACSPPTARPGYSYHERGLAIDFMANGRFINSRSNPGFVWLAANAGRFGFYNLPSEPWHWDTRGT